jgi:hypothetical protein
LAAALDPPPLPGSTLLALNSPLLQYYYGAQNQIQRAVVQNILNSMVKELAWNPDRKFIYVEVTHTVVVGGASAIV